MNPAGLYYEELEWGHGAPAWRCLSAGALELLYVLGSAGQAQGLICEVVWYMFPAQRVQCYKEHASVLI